VASGGPYANQTDNHASTSPFSFHWLDALPNVSIKSNIDKFNSGITAKGNLHCENYLVRQGMTSRAKKTDDLGSNS